MGEDKFREHLSTVHLTCGKSGQSPKLNENSTQGMLLFVNLITVVVCYFYECCCLLFQ